MNITRNNQDSNIGFYLMAIAVILFMSIVGWYINQWVIQYLSHDSATAAVCEMVKPEALINPTDCRE